MRMIACHGLITLVLAAAPAEHVQCPAGYGAVVHGNTVACEPLAPPSHAVPSEHTPAAATTVINREGPLYLESAGHGATHDVTLGLQRAPQICGLGRESSDIVRSASEM